MVKAIVPRFRLNTIMDLGCDLCPETPLLRGETDILMIRVSFHSRYLVLIASKCIMFASWLLPSKDIREEETRLRKN